MRQAGAVGIHVRGALAAGIVLAIAGAGCSSTGGKRRQLEEVARDWCRVLRASQVIPVYPLTEDLQPGDLFLVQMPVDRQQEAYERKGFLPLDNHLARLTPEGYADFYRNSFLLGAKSPSLPNEGLAASPAWSNVAKAAFPSYSFVVERGAGLSLALPVRGVPIGLSLLGSSSAYGSITLSDARTYGVDIASLERDVRERVTGDPALAALLGTFASTGGRTNFLRVVGRIYLVGEVDIALQDASAAGGHLKAGASPPPLDLLTAPSDSDLRKSSVDSYGNSLEAINRALGEGESALAVKVVSATARSVGLREKFSRPLVVGYLGFDMAILEGGRLGPAVPTHALLTGGAYPAQLLDTLYLRREVEGRADAEGLYPKVLRSIDPEREARYREEVNARRGTPTEAFRRALTDFLEPEIAEADGPRHERLRAALSAVLQ